MSLATIQTPTIKNQTFRVLDKKTICPKSNCHHKGVYYTGTDFVTLPPRVEAIHHYECANEACSHQWTRLAN